MNKKPNDSLGEKWYTRPVFSVNDVQASVDYYCGLLEFTQSWKYEESQKLIVTQVAKGDFELILAGNLDRVGMARVFVSLDASEMTRLQNRISSMRIPFEKLVWGYPTIQLKDPDNNLLMFPLEEE